MEMGISEVEEEVVEEEIVEDFEVEEADLEAIVADTTETTILAAIMTAGAIEITTEATTEMTTSAEMIISTITTVQTFPQPTTTII